MEVHVHTNASLLNVGAMFSYNVTRKNDQLVVYAFRLLNRVDERENLEQWLLLCTSSNIIYWAIIVYFMCIIWL